MNDVFIHGLGLLTPLGSGASANWRAIRQGRELTDRGVIAPELLAQCLCAASCPVPVQSYDRVVNLAAAGLAMALCETGWPPELYRSADTGLFVATSKGSILTCLKALGVINKSSPANLDEMTARHVALGPAMIAAALADLFGLIGPVHTSVAACAGALVALHRAMTALRRGDCRRTVVVAADASADPFFESSFERLGVLAAPDGDGHRRCRPFDPSGAGFFISEAAAAVCLSLGKPEPSASADRCLVIDGTWMGADATHLVAADTDAVSLKRGLRQLLGGGKVEFVHAHATGTHFDRRELEAIRATCGQTIPIFSHKRWLGHSLGASGLVALVLSAACHQAHETLDGRPLTGPARSLTIAQGFGGHIALAALRGPELAAC